jgi:serine protease Do
VLHGGSFKVPNARPRPTMRPMRGGFLAAIAGLFAAVCVQAAGPAEISPKELYERSRPAVCMIGKRFQATITVPTPAVGAELFEEVRKSLDQGREKHSAAAIGDAIERVLPRKPTAYIVRTAAVRDFDEVFSSMGSGFLATPRGHVITNAHVVNVRSTEIWAEAKKKYMDRDCQRLITYIQKEFNELKDMPKSRTDAFVMLLHAGLDDFYKRYTQITWTRTCTVLMRYIDANGEVQFRECPADVVEVGKSIPGKDVAVLKIDAAKLQNSLELGDETHVKVGDRIYVLGYPGAGTFHPVLSKARVAEAALSSGIVTAKKTAATGWPLLQHDAATAAGNSGGPAFDKFGRVIGIHTFGSLTDAGEKIQGGNFIVPASVVKEFLERAGAGPDAVRKTKPDQPASSASEPPKREIGEDPGLEKR